MVYIFIMVLWFMFWWGASYSSVYVPPPVCIFHSLCTIYPCGICLHSALLYCIFLFLYPHIPLVLLSANCVTFIDDWMKTFGGVGI